MNVKMSASQGIHIIEFQIFVVVFFRQEQFKKSKQIFDTINSTTPNQT